MTNHIDDKTVAEQLAPRLLSGEIHYWRVNPQRWPTLLTRAAELGLPSVASYIQWEYHEYEPGRFDFTGETDERRNLVGYLDHVASSGLGLIIRPGPYTFAEWRNYGVPDYVTPYHRLHPGFREPAGRWIDAVCDVLRPYLATGGGPIFLLQADNMFDIGQNRYDRQLGLLGGGGPFSKFLRQKYSTVDALNASWASEYADFDDAIAMMANASPQAKRRHDDFLEFKGWFTAQAAVWTRDRYRSAGIDVPIYSNATADQDLRQMVEIFDLVGLNHYPTCDYAPPGEHLDLTNRIRLADALTPYGYVAELESGIWHGFHYTKGVPHPDHYRLMLSTILAGGAGAWNWYMLHDRDNWYMAPLNENGEIRHEVADVIRAASEIWTNTKPWTWTRSSHAGVTIQRAVIGAEGPTSDTASAVTKAFYDAGIDHALVDLRGRRSPPPLLFWGGGSVSRDDADTLRAYVEGGGHLVFWGEYPDVDELPVIAPDGSYANGYMDTFHKDVTISFGAAHLTLKTPAQFGTFRHHPGEPIHALLTAPDRVISDNVLDEYRALTALGAGEQLTVGYHVSVGDGTLTVLALERTAPLVAAIHEGIGIDIAARPLANGIKTSRFHCPEADYLAILNPHPQPQIAAIKLTGINWDDWNCTDLFTPDVRPLAQADDGMLLAELPERTGTLFKLSRRRRRG